MIAASARKLIFACGAVALVASPLEAWELALKNNATVADAEVCLTDVASLTGEGITTALRNKFSDLCIMPTPVKPFILEDFDIEAVLIRSGLTASRIHGSKVHIKPRTRKITRTELHSLARRALLRRGADSLASFTVRELPDRSLSIAADALIETTLVPANLTPGHKTLLVHVLSRRNRPVAEHQIRFRLEHEDRHVAAVKVKRGTLVNLQFTRGAISIRLVGRCQKNAYAGEVVSVKAVASGKVFQARLLSISEAEVIRN